MNLNFCILSALVCVGVSEAMNATDDGVCPRELRSVTKIKRVAETVRYKCGKTKTCTKLRHRSQMYKETLPTLACCDGFEWIEETDTCRRLCKPPLVLVDNNCTLPVCDPSCTNGRCTENNTCVCNEGYLKGEDNHTCTINCTDCENGACSAPNVCECNTGYTRIGNKCLPTCKSKCINGFCSEPDVCSCNVGYEPKGASKEFCQPKCDSCVNGDCIGPNQCSCHKGYEMIDKVCRPVCENACVNSTCVAPNSCECLAGFESTAKKEICRPRCDACVNGDCVSPNKCICRKGYRLQNNTCTSICEDKCVNGKCVAPNKCECLDGFEHKIGHEAVCIPKCGSCVHGECVAPNKCVCLRGYGKTEDGCKPKCENACVNGDCTSPNKCTCHEGYMRNETSPSVCYKACGDCGMGSCSLDGVCICGEDSKFVNGTCLSLATIEASGMESSPGLASLEMSWLVGGAVGLLLIVLVVVTMQRMWRRQKAYGAKNADSGNTFGSVIYTLPDTLIRNTDNIPKNEPIDEDHNESDEESTSERLMAQPNGVV